MKPIIEIREGIEDSSNLIQIYTESGIFLIESGDSSIQALCASEDDYSSTWLPLLRGLSTLGTSLPQHLSTAALTLQSWWHRL